ncbi:hypothetical protein DM01DRAFT_1342778 [Hesseltinella vesiculosa]|uniref:Uncharacterized protein n=1 Tax=Hesseltinella vesiculosa TaxID=101127 RepID=A0A1X2GS31_9FUNG|nr:hypothetical protein DM01DRAFT_1342778 [Hesseltinella vesiculosa]
MFEHLFGFGPHPTSPPTSQSLNSLKQLQPYTDPTGAFDYNAAIAQVDVAQLPNLAFLTNQSDLPSQLHLQEPDPFASIHNDTSAASLHDPPTSQSDLHSTLHVSTSRSLDHSSFASFSSLDNAHAITEAALSALYPPVDIGNMSPILSMPAILPPLNDRESNDLHYDPKPLFPTSNTSSLAKPHSEPSKSTSAPSTASSSPSTGPSLNPTTSVLQPDDLEPPSKKLKHYRRFGERAPWNAEEDELLRIAVSVYGDKTEKWSKIAECVPGRTNKNCRKRWFHSLDPSLRKGAWTTQEDHILRQGVQRFPNQWSKIADLLKGRTDDQCAKRWRESLDPTIDRSDWSVEEDLRLADKFTEYGSQWQKIAQFFDGRPGLHCRNRWRKLQRMNQLKKERPRHSRHGPSPHLGRTKPTLTPDLSHPLATLPSSSSSMSSQPAGSFIHHPSTALPPMLSTLNTFGQPPSSMIPFHDKRQQDYEAPEPLAHLDPYGCAVPDCLAAFSHSSNLFYHMKKHHPDLSHVAKPYRCGVPNCNKKYKNINGLQYHVREAKGTTGHAYASTDDPDQHKQKKPKTSDAASPSSSTSSSPAAPPPAPTSQPPTSSPVIHPGSMHNHSIHNSHDDRWTPRVPTHPSDDTTFICPIFGCRKKFSSVQALHQHQDHTHSHSHPSHSQATVTRSSSNVPSNKQPVRPPSQQQFRLKREKWIIESA